jgi:hypothetical protein
MDRDFSGINGRMIPYSERLYRCLVCGHDGPGWTLLQQSPSTFLTQPNELYPMSQEDFDHWVDILRTHFPNDPHLAGLGVSFIRCSPEEALRRIEIQLQQCLDDERLRPYVPTLRKKADEFRGMTDQADYTPPSEVK